MTVAVVSCCYGTHVRFALRWRKAIQQLDPAPDRVIVATDTARFVEGLEVVTTRCRWQHLQAWHLHQAIAESGTDWVWIVDIDDLARPDGLAGLDQVDGDVWQLGYTSSDGHEHRPPMISNADYLGLDSNPYAGGSMIRVDAYHAAGGMPDLAFQDWGLWRRLARNGAVFEASDRSHFDYMRHPFTRTHTELLSHRRADNYAAMLESEAQLVA